MLSLFSSGRVASITCGRRLLPLSKYNNTAVAHSTTRQCIRTAVAVNENNAGVPFRPNDAGAECNNNYSANIAGTAARKQTASSFQSLTRRVFSSSSSSPSSLATTATSSSPLFRELQPTPPTAVNKQMVVGVQDAVQLLLNHGLGKQRLDQIAAHSASSQSTPPPPKDQEVPLVIRWQKMMEAFLGTQVHVLAGLGYPPNEQGIQLYHQQLGAWLQHCDPDTQEELRIKTRDTWRTVMKRAFAMLDDSDAQEEGTTKEELSIVDARNMMHKVSMKMQEPEILEMVSKQCSSIISSSAPEQEKLAAKHTVVQQVLVNHVYMGSGDGTGKSLLEELGFDPDERGYILMQCALAEHQNDPLVGQYVGSGMMKLLKAAGIDLQQAQQAAAAGTM